MERTQEEKAKEFWEKLSQILEDHYGRPPTEEELYIYVIGNPEERQYIWNFGMPKPIRRNYGSKSRTPDSDCNVLESSIQEAYRKASV